MEQAPQYSDLDIEFDSIEFNTLEEVDLSAVDDIVCSMARSSPANAVRYVFRRSVVPAKFAVDNIEKKVVVTVLATDIGEQAGVFYINLYIFGGGKKITHLPKSIEIIKTVKYEVS